MLLTPQLDSVLARYPASFRPERIEPLGSAGGFSGAELWRITTADGRQQCLRRWPLEHPTPERLAFIHAILRHVGTRLGADVHWIPVPLSTLAGHSFLSEGGSLWELTPWLPGTADFHSHASPIRLAAALKVLARFHLAASDFPHSGPVVSKSPAMTERCDMVRKFLGGGREQIAESLHRPNWPELEARGRRLLTLFPLLAPRILRELTTAAEWPVPLQPCLRDIWHDHVLFQGDEVTGLVDFGAMRIECVSGDIARLLGSLVRDDMAVWQSGLAAYESVRPLSPVESRLISIFDRSAVLLSGMNWLTWICVEQRVFVDRPRIIARLDETLGRLEHLKTM